MKYLKITYIDGTEETIERKLYANSDNISYLLASNDNDFLSFTRLDGGREVRASIRRSDIKRVEEKDFEK